MTRAELATEVSAIVVRLERLQAEVRTPDVTMTLEESALIEARVSVRRLLETIEARAEAPERRTG